MSRKFVASLGLLLGLLCAAGQAVAQQKLKVGFLSTFSGPSADIGQQMLEAFNLGIKHLNGKIGGLEVEVVQVDDQSKPDVGRQLAERLVERDRVDVVTGTVFSNVFQAMYKPVLDGGALILSPQAHFLTLAGKECSPNFFMLGTQSDNYSESVGMLATKLGYKRVYLLAPKYTAGNQALTGFKRHYKGEIAGEAQPAFGQLDFAAELAQARAAKPDAVYAFLPGGMGIAFMKQFTQANMHKEMQFLGGWAQFDPWDVLGAVGEGSIGMLGTSDYHPDFKNATNERFVKDYLASTKRYPSHYAAASYDVVMLLDAAIKATKGDLRDKKALSAALKSVKWNSVRGDTFRFNNNNFPIADHFATKVVKAADGSLRTSLGERIVAELKDPFYSECPLK